MASGFIGNEVPRKGLRVRVPCPPLNQLVRLALAGPPHSRQHTDAARSAGAALSMGDRFCAAWSAVALLANSSRSGLERRTFCKFLSRQRVAANPARGGSLLQID